MVPFDVVHAISTQGRTGRLDARYLRELPTLHGLTEDELHTLAVNATWHIVHRHQDIFGVYVDTAATHVVGAGVVGAGWINASGQAYLGWFLSEGDFLSGLDIAPSVGHAVSWRAMTEPVIVFQFAEEASDRVLTGSPAYQDLVHRQRVQWTESCMEALHDFAMYDARGRFARTLARVATHCDQGFVDLTHDELGWITGLGRAQVTAFLGELRRRGLVAYAWHKRGIYVPCPKRLSTVGDAAPCGVSN